MSRRKHHEDHVNHEAWAIPYADLMTLLLAFFVVMYAVSVVNEGKYRVMSQSIIEAFNGTSRRLDPVHSSNVAPVAPVPADRKNSQAQNSVLPRIAPPLPTRNLATSSMQNGTAKRQNSEQENLERIQDQVQRALQPLIDKSLVVVRRTKTWLEIEIRTDILFPSGVARLSAPADDVLNHIASILAPFPNPLRVEGYTDDKPINTAVYPSNWELSAARAASVARLFVEQGIDPSRLGIIGWGEIRPAADNVSEEGRNRNRRVLVVVLSDRSAPVRFYSDANHPLAEVEPTLTPSAPPAVDKPIVVKPDPPTDVVPINTSVVATQAPVPEVKG
ncbi:flagellar motor protein MotD [Dyella tabacisoli]|uniref:Flagellar motor protein MotD n=1 Tax=Dyella tabacisoli TaxID=2282381 RepID=A0A369UNG6_9GAMM|nr:flagellar motor protein MotD [Dyella tabacisoli]RDD79859.1 flagellar motor protein MotD [Dyella tabacisoli]